MSNLDTFFNSLLPEITLSRIMLEKRIGLLPFWDDPHIDFDGERESQSPRITETPTFTKIDIKVYEKIATSSNNLRPQNSCYLNNNSNDLRANIKLAVIPVINPDMRGMTAQQYFSLFKETLFINGISNINNVMSLNDSVNNVNVVKNLENYNQSSFVKDINHGAKEPKDFYLLYATFLEIPADMASMYSADQKMIFSDIKVETVLENYIVKSTAEILVLKENNSLWPGAVKINDDRTYSTVEDSPRELIPMSIKNYKVQDFRIKSKIDSVNINFLSNNQKLLSLQRKKIVKTEIRPNYFSDLNLATQGKKVSVSFFLKYKDLMLQNCLFSRIYDNLKVKNSLVNEILNKSSIIDFKIVRRRVSENGYNNNRLTFESNVYDSMMDVEEVVVSSAQDDSGILQKKSTLKEIKNIFPQFANKNRNFYAIDSEILKYKDYGIYQYGVEMEIRDGSVSMLLDDIDRLSSHYSHLNSFYNQSVLKEINKKMPDLVELSKSSDMIEQSIDTYFEILKKYYYLHEISEDEFLSIKNNIKSQVSIFSSENTRGIYNFINLLDTLISNLRQIVSDEVYNFDDPHIEGQENNIRRKSKDTFVLKHYFENDYYDTNIYDKTLIKYLPEKSKSLFFNEFSVENFIDLLNGYNKTINNGRLTVTQPLSILTPFDFDSKKLDVPLPSYMPAFSSRISNRQNKKKGDNLEHNKHIRDKLVNYVNISVYSQDIVQNTEEVKNENDDKGVNNQVSSQGMFTLSPPQTLNSAETSVNFEKEVMDFYDFCSLKISKQKTNLELKKLISLGVLKDFLVNPQFLHDSFLQKEEWQTIERLGFNTSFEFSDQSYLIFMMRPVNNDYRQEELYLSTKMKYSDMFFFVKVPNRGSLDKLLGAIKNNLEETKKNLGISPPTVREAIADIVASGRAEEILSAAENPLQDVDLSIATNIATNSLSPGALTTVDNLSNNFEKLLQANNALNLPKVKLIK